MSGHPPLGKINIADMQHTREDRTPLGTHMDISRKFRKTQAIIPIIFALIIIQIFIPATSFAAREISDNTSSAQPGSTEIIPDGVIELSKLLSEADAAETNIAQYINNISWVEIDVPEPEILKSDIQASHEKIQNKFAQKALSAAFLSRELQDWKTRADNMESQFQDIQGKVSSVEAAQKELSKIQALWQNTYESYKASKNRDAPMERIENILSQTKSGIAQLEAGLTALMKKQETIVGNRDIVKAHLKYIENYKDEIGRSLWRKNAPSIFDSNFYINLVEIKSSDIRTRWKDNYDEFSEYLLSVQKKIATEIIALFIVWLFVRWIAPKLKSEKENLQAIEDLKSFFEHPLSISTIVVIIPASFYHQEAPILVKELFRLILAVPMIVLLVKINRVRKLQFFILGIGLCYLIGIPAMIFAGIPSIEQIIVIGQAILALLATMIFLDPASMPERYVLVNRNIFVRAIKFFKKYIFVILGLVILLELAGYRQLGCFINDAAFKSVALTLFIMTMHRLLIGIMTLIVHSGFSAKFTALSKHTREVLAWLNKWIAVSAAIVWISLFVRLWQIHRTFWAVVDKVFGLGFTLGPNRFSLGIAAAAIFAIYISVKLSKIIQIILNDDVYTKRQLGPGLGEAINQSLHYLLIFIGIATALSILGIKMQNLAIVAGALGVGIGFGMQNIVNNFVSGLIMLVERPIKIGDVLEIDGTWGVVKKIGIRATLIETLDNAEIIMPNGDLFWSKLTNWTHSNAKNRILIPLGVSYNSKPDKVIELLKRIVESNPNVLADPPPSVAFIGFGDSSLDFELRFYLPSIDLRVKVSNEIRTAVFDEFKKEGIEIPYPHRVLISDNK